MALPNATLAKPPKKKPTDGLDDLVDARMSASPAQPKGKVETSARPESKSDAVQAAKDIAKAEAEANAKGRVPDPLDELAAERAAAAAELDADKAKALQGASARAGAGGFGLSGGTSAQLSDIGRVQDRNKLLTMADFDRMAEDRAFTDIQRDATVDDAEMAADFDYNDDGFIGGQKVGGKIGDRDVENDPVEKPKDEEDAKRALDEAKAQLPAQDLYIGDADTGSGTREEPYTFDSMAALAKWFRETTGMEPELASEDYGGRLVIRDQFGNYYTLTNQ